MKNIFLILLFFNTQTLFPFALGIRQGPPAVGQGGPNPISIPPSLIDSQIYFATEKGFETQLSVTGLLFGHRTSMKWGGYISLGGGFVLDANGGGLGIYSGFGYDFWCGWGGFCSTVEYLQAVGMSGGTILSPYAVRLGVTVWTD